MRSCGRSKCGLSILLALQEHKWEDIAFAEFVGEGMGGPPQVNANASIPQAALTLAVPSFADLIRRLPVPGMPHQPYTQRMVRLDDWKLIYYHGYEQPYQLFNLREDPVQRPYFCSCCF